VNGSDYTVTVRVSLRGYLSVAAITRRQLAKMQRDLLRVSLFYKTAFLLHQKETSFLRASRQNILTAGEKAGN